MLVRPAGRTLGGESPLLDTLQGTCLHRSRTPFEAWKDKVIVQVEVQATLKIVRKTILSSDYKSMKLEFDPAAKYFVNQKRRGISLSGFRI